MQHADVRRDFVHVVMRELGDDAASAIAEGYAQLEAQALDALGDEGFSKEDTTFGYELDLHYEGQQWDVRVSLAPDATPDEIRAAFEREYDRQFGHTNPESRINVAKLRVVGIGKLPPLQDPTYEPVDKPVEAIETRPVYAESVREFLDTPVYRGADLHHGQTFAGPAIIEEATTTILVGPGDLVSIDALNNYTINFETED
jgi:N-methylhydantoinase A